jgi:hypothetical protein
MRRFLTLQQRMRRTPTRWWKRAGLISFGFFFIKGLLWLTVPLMWYWFG